MSYFVVRCMVPNYEDYEYQHIIESNAVQFVPPLWPEEAAAEMSVCVHAGVVTGLIYVSAVLSVDGAGVTVLMLLCKVGDHLSHDIEKVVLKELEIKAVDIVRALLYHYRAGRVVRYDSNCTVLNAGSVYDSLNLLRNIVEGGDPTSGLELKLLLKNFHFHSVKFSFEYINFLFF